MEQKFSGRGTFEVFHFESCQALQPHHINLFKIRSHWMAISSLPASRKFSDAKSIVVLVIFLLVAFVTIQPISVPVPTPAALPRLLYRLRLRKEQKAFEKHMYYLRLDLNVGPSWQSWSCLPQDVSGLLSSEQGLPASEMFIRMISCFYFFLSYVSLPNYAPWDWPSRHTLLFP